MHCGRAVMKQSLRGLFKSYGDVLDVVAHKNLRMRGQAFVSFADAEIARKAMKEVKGFPLYSKPMVCRFPPSFNLSGFQSLAFCWNVANLIRTNAVRCGSEQTRP